MSASGAVVVFENEALAGADGQASSVSLAWRSPSQGT
jgi:hypothetical protein